jgi:vacuolar-type H+-ATPase subunit I/STV1
MSKHITTTLLAALLLAALGLGGCGLLNNGVNDANGLINDANVNLKNQQVASEKMSKLTTELDGLGSTPQDATRGLEITAQIRAELQTQSTELQAAAAKIGKIKALDVDDTFKEYADLKVAALVAQQAVVEKGLVMFAEMDKVFIAVRDGNATAKVTAALSASIKAMSDEIAQLSGKSLAAAAAADAYAEKNLPK